MALAALWALPVAAKPVWTFPGTLAVFAQRLHAACPILSHNASLSLPSASIIKLVILVGIVRQIDAGHLRWSSELQIRGPEIVGASESFGQVVPGTRATVRRLADAMVAQSDNTAGNVFADHLSFAGVNAVAASLHLNQTRIRRHFMDFAARARGIDNTTSAADMGRLLLGVERGARGMPSPVATARSCREIVMMMLEQEDRDTIPAGVHRHVSIANKTGVLNDVRNDAAIIDPFGRDPYVLVLLSRFAPSQTRRAYARLQALASAVDALEQSDARVRAAF